MNGVASYFVEVLSFTFEYFVSEPGEENESRDRGNNADGD